MVKMVGYKTQMKENEHRGNYPTIILNRIKVKQVETVQYLGIHLNIKLTWYNHIFT